MQLLRTTHVHSALRTTSIPILLCLVLSLNGCTWHARQNPGSPYTVATPGSVLKINRKIEIPPGSTRIFFQNGRISPAFNHYVPNCNIEINTLSWTAVQYVEPGTYRVSRVQRSLEEVVRNQPIKIAARGPMLAGLGGDGDGSAMVYAGYHLWLDSADPNVRRLSCRGAVADPHEAFPPSIDEIRGSLGNIMTLEIY